MAYGTDMTQSLRGVFIPLWLIARPEIGHGAKLLYVLLAQKAGVKGIARAFIPALATELGDDEAQIYKYLNELESRGLVEVRRQDAEAEILHCAFPAYEPSGRASAREIYGGKSDGRQQHPDSRHSLEICVRYAKAKKRSGEEIRNVYALGTHFHRTGYQDEEIDMFLTGGETFDVSADLSDAGDIQ
ncbi:MAG: hypothetical protein H0T60_09425 [Acidobacteria bacterium]|nr:hypothetical protein [Acidobacteriota bacterium]